MKNLYEIVVYLKEDYSESATIEVDLEPYQLQIPRNELNTMINDNFGATGWFYYDINSK